MNIEDKQYFKSKLIKEKCKLENIISRIQDSYALNNGSMDENGPNMFQNSPEESVNEIYDKESAISMKNNENILISKIDSALEAIDNDTYGNCRMCSKEIARERLEVVPYAEYCIECQNVYNERAKAEQCISKEEEARIENNEFMKLSNFYNDFRNENVLYNMGTPYDKVELDLMDDIYENEEEGYVEPIERISNEQYKNTIQ